MRLRVSLLLAVILISHGFTESIYADGIYADNRAYAQYSEEAARIAASLDDNALAAQVLLTGIEGKAALSPAMWRLLERIPAGGIMLFKYNLDSPKEDVKALLSETIDIVAAKNGIPPFMAVDHEGGLVHRFGDDVERLPSAYSFWELAQTQGIPAALAKADAHYRRSAREIRELGITMVLGPVAETLDVDNRIFLESRSYGPSRYFVEMMASAFVRGMDAAGVASVVKHFPGNTAVDPHSGVSSIRAGRSVLDEMAKPFAGIIRGLAPGAIMISHVMVPALDPRRNASLSSIVIQDWLRGELGFEGIVVADDFSMGAIGASSPQAAGIEALNAGVDMIMVWPKDLSATHAAILEALRNGRLPRERLLEAAGRVIAGKLRYALMERN
jgi:beta-N-acetylhexosaminidase